MKKLFLSVFAAVVLLAAALPALAQQAPPPVLQIYREEIKPGKTVAHAKHEEGWPRAFAKAKFPTHYIAASSVSGPGEAWYFTPYDSLAAWEKDGKDVEANATLQAEMDRLGTVDGDMLNSVRSIVAVYRPDLSYQTGSSAPLPTMRYFMITTVRVRPGREADFEESTKMARAAHEKISVPERWAVFQINYGALRGTFLIFQPLKSLADVDAFAQTHGEKYQAAIGESGQKKLRELAASGVISAETNLFAFSPKMSYPAPDWVAADPDFWAPKPKAAPAKKPAQ